MKKDQTLYIASAVALAFTGMTMGGAEAAPERKHCYGVAKAGENDCKAGPGTSCRGSATQDYQPNAWKALTGAECRKQYKELLADGKIKIETHPFRWIDD